MKPTILILMLILIPLISAVQVGNVGTEGINFVRTTPVNYSTVNVNNSLFLQGYVPNDFWQVVNAQNGLTGNKNGSFNLTTTDTIKVALTSGSDDYATTIKKGNINTTYNITLGGFICNWTNCYTLANFLNDTTGQDNASWNESYANTKYAKYQSTNNDFNGSGSFVTTGNINSSSYTIGNNVLTTSEFQFLDGSNQQLRTNSSPTFTGYTVLNKTYINAVDTNALKIDQFAVMGSVFIVDTVNGWVAVGGNPANTRFSIFGSHVASYGLMQLSGKAAGTHAYLTFDAGLQKEAGFYFKDNGVTKWYLYEDGADSNKFKLEGTSGVVLTALSNGNIGIGTTTPQYPLHVAINTSATNQSISAYFENNISAKGFITRTSVYDKLQGSALDKIKDASAYENPDGTINHKSFYGYVGGIKDIDYSKPIIKEKCRDDICINETTYPYTKIVEGVELGKEIDVLRQGTWELNQIIKEQNNTINNLNNKIKLLCFKTGAC